MAIKINGDNSTAAVGLTGGDDDSGVKPGSNQVEIVTGGTARINVTNSDTKVTNTLKVANIQNDGASAANVVLNSDTSISIPGAIKHVGDDNTLIEFDTDTVKLQTNGTTRLVIDSSGRNLINFPTTSVFGSNSLNPWYAKLQICGDTTGYGGAGRLNLTTNQANTNNTAAGFLMWSFNDGGEIARIQANGETGAGSNDYPGNLRFLTNSGTTHPSERMRIQSDGNVNIIDGNLIVGNGHGIDFSAQTATNQAGASTDVELFDHYEEGTFTPTMNYATAYGTQSGKYVKIGKTVYCNFEIQVTNFGGVTTASTSVGGLPFAGASGGNVTGCWGAVINAASSSKDWRIGPWTAISASLGVWMHGGGSTTGIGMDTTSFSNYSSVTASLGTNFTMRGGVTYIAST